MQHFWRKFEKVKGKQTKRESLEPTELILYVKKVRLSRFIHTNEKKKEEKRFDKKSDSLFEIFLEFFIYGSFLLFHNRKFLKMGLQKCNRKKTC